MNGNEKTFNLSIHFKLSNSRNSLNYRKFRQYDETYAVAEKSENIIKVFWMEGMVYLHHLPLQLATR